MTQFCFKLNYVGCAIASPCCLKEVNDVSKIEFSSGPQRGGMRWMTLTTSVAVHALILHAFA